MSEFLAMQRAVWTSTRTANEKLVLLALIDFYSEASRHPFPSVATLAARSSLGRTTVLDALAALERDGVLAVRREFGRPNRYDLSRVCAALAPVRVADQSASRTGHGGRPQGGDKRSWDAHSARGDLREQIEESHGHEREGAAAQQPGPVREAYRSSSRTGPSGGRDQSAGRTGPVRVADTKEAKKEPKKEATRARELATLAQVLELPVAERAKLALQSPRDGERLRPREWPEVRGIVQAFGAAIGRERKLSELSHDAGLRSVVSLLAAEHDPKDLEWVAAKVPKQRWWRQSDRSHGLASLSPEVVARALEERDRSSSRGLLRIGSSRELSDERRLARNSLLENAKAGQYGAEYQLRAKASNLRELADELEGLRDSGQLRFALVAAPAAGKKPPHTRTGDRDLEALHASRSLAVLMSAIRERAPVKCAPDGEDGREALTR